MYRIAVDIGGTFTDGVIEDTRSGTVWLAKSLSTPSDPGEAVSAVIVSLLAKAGEAGAGAVTEVVHGNTIVTNTLIERKGARAALVVTEGMADLVEMGREVRYDLYDLGLELPEPLVPRERRVEVRERTAADGSVVLELAEAEIARVAALVAELDVQSVAIACLHSSVSPAHELRLAGALRRLLPGVSITASSRVAGEVREYERTTTATANAYVQPLVESYLRELEARLRAQSISAPLQIMVSSGGFTSAAAAADVPIALLESGPAGGVLSAAHAGRAAGLANVLAFDMGGTTAKLCVVLDGEPSIAHSFETARVHRFRRGSGLPILIPSIDLIEIGAGGGSIASLNSLGLLKIGPESAGSVPGPVCYGRGGSDVTVTDADLALGYLDPASFLGGEMELDREGAERALARLGSRLGLSALEAAVGIVSIVNENMAAAARVHIAEKGHDPRQFILVATGGAGPVHAVSVAQRLGLSKVLFPIGVGAGSCLGFLAAPARADRSWSKIASVKAIDWRDTAARLAALKEGATEELVHARVDPADCNWAISVEMRFAGQGAAVSVSFPFREVDASFEGELVNCFLDRYRHLFGGVVPAATPETVTWRVSATGRAAHGSFVWPEPPAERAEPRSRRDVFLPKSNAMGSVPVYDRYSLATGTEIAGPAIIEERESTLVVPFPSRISVLPDRAVLVELQP